jgi:hypothetical protein
MPTARLSEKARSLLRELARDSGEPMQTVLELALEAYRRQRFLEANNRAFAALRERPEEWEGELEERREWDCTSADGLGRA